MNEVVVSFLRVYAACRSCASLLPAHSRPRWRDPLTANVHQQPR